MAGKRQRLHEEEEHENHERWLVTYADMVTLLMVLFIVLFAMSQVDQKKFAALKDGLAAGFGQSTSILDGSTSILDEAGLAAMPPVAPDRNFEEIPEVTLAARTAVDQSQRLEEQRRYDEARVEAERLGEVEAELAGALEAKGLADDVQASYDGRGLVLSLVSKHVVFANDSAELTARGREVVDTLGPVLAGLEESLQVDGHTNQVAVKPKYFATDWDLSAARALTVLARLQDRIGIAGERLSLAAYGHEKPLVDPDEPGSQAVNKRVDIVVLSPLSPETRSLLGEVAEPAPDTKGHS